MEKILTSEISYIYGLKSSKDNLIRYIGCSISPLKRREKHIVESKLNLYKRHKWINKEINSNNEILIEILECYNRELIFEKEIEYILLFKSFGANLINGNNGGLGGTNPSKEVREKISKSKMGNKWNINRVISEETRLKISKAHIGKICSETTREKIKKFNLNRGYRAISTIRKITEEQFIKIYELYTKKFKLKDIILKLNLSIKDSALLMIINNPIFYKDWKEKYNIVFQKRKRPRTKVYDERYFEKKEKDRIAKNKKYEIIKIANNLKREIILTKIKELYLQGLSPIEIGENVKKHERTIRRIISKNKWSKVK